MYSTGAYVLVLLVLAMAFAPEDAEMLNYGWLYLLSGGISLVAVFSLNDPASMPRTAVGKMLSGGIAGILTFVFRQYLGGEGALPAVLVVNLLTPLLEYFTLPQDYYATGKRRKTPKQTASAGRQS